MNIRRPRTYIITSLLVLSVIAACKHKKAITKSNEPVKDTVKSETRVTPPAPKKTMNFTVNNWSSFSSKINIDYESDTRSLPINSFSGQIRMSKDKFIWLSISVPILGEAGRALITKDSVKILDRYNRRYMLTNFSYLQKFSSVPLSLAKLQDALMGNPTFELKEASEIDTAEAMLRATYQDAKINNIIYALMTSLRVQKNIYFDRIQNVDITAVYNSFETIEGQVIPSKINFSTSKPEKSTSKPKKSTPKPKKSTSQTRKSIY